MIIETPGTEDYDVVVIGSGPAGITTALRIAESKPSARIAIVETGLLEQNNSAQQLSQVTTQGDLASSYYSVHQQRRFGGTSAVWAGWCATLEQRAFEHEEWPISYEDIYQYYPEAADILEVSSNVYLNPQTSIEGCPNLVYRPYHRSPPVRFGEKYLITLEQHPTVDLIINKTCTSLEQQGSRIMEAILADSIDPAIEAITLQADHFVLACGGVGNPRLLQLSGIAEQSPVGRYLADHPHLYGVSRLYLDEEKLRVYTDGQSDVVHALQLTSDYCIEQGILSFGVQFNLNDVVDNPLLGRKKSLALSNVTIRAEMVPDYDNYVSLGEQSNEHGDPRTHVNFRFNYDDLAYQSWQIFSDELLRSGLGRAASMPTELTMGGGGHLIGTTRMGLYETESVVDTNCRVHTTDNLYVAGSSVFPAGGAANPTYTIVAMALRLGDHLAAQVGGDRT